MTELSKLNEMALGTNLVHETILTYIDLSNSYCDFLRKDQRSKQEIKNAQGTITSWCKALKILVTTPINEEFTSNFEKKIQAYIKIQIDKKLSKSTYSSRVSILKKIQLFYNKHLEHLTLPTGFGKRLRYVLNLKKYSAKSFWEHHLQGNLGYETFLKWIIEKTLPGYSKRRLIQVIENHLGIPETTLSSQIKTVGLYRFIKKDGKTQLPKYRVWTSKLDIEYADLIEFKTCVVLPAGMKRGKNAVWTGKEGELPPSSHINKGLLKSFFGYLCLSPAEKLPYRGLGKNAEQMSLALLSDVTLVEKFVTVFLPGISGGKFNNGCFSFLNFVTSLLRKDTGYLYQKAEFALKLKLQHDVNVWQEHCLRTRKRLTEIIEFIQHEKKSGGKQFGFGRDPEKPIKTILESPHPLLATIQMTKEMYADVKKIKTGTLNQSILYRDMLLIAMLQANPLRIKMYSNLKFDEHLIKKTDGSWWLVFKRHEFKNRRYLKSDYEAQVVSDLWYLIDEYKSKFWNRLGGSKASLYVFPRSITKPSAKIKTLRLGEVSLYSSIKKRTKQYIPNCEGFGPHAFRHLVATDIIKRDPRWVFFLAAKVLHDKQDTVERNYAHLKTSDFYEPYNDLFSDMWRNTISPDDLGINNDENSCGRISNEQ